MYTIIDIETTGSKPDYDKIIDIAIYLHNGKEIVDTFSSLVNPERYIPEFITRLTGISNEMVENAPKFYEIAKKIVEFTEGHIFVAHNVHFDYSFVKAEFKNLGFNFQRKTLCTLRLSRKLIPHLPSYSLGRLCESIGIDLKDRHRANGDAEATAKLFTKLVQINKEQIENDVIEEEVKFPTLPPKIKREQVSALPEEVGVYYFHDEQGSVIYVGKSINIKKRIATHFQLFDKNRKSAQLKDTIADISYVLTGNELIALLLESEEIKNYKPRFNKALRRSSYNYGIFVREDKNAYLHLFAEKVKNQARMPIYFTESVAVAKFIIEKYQQKYELCQKFCDMYRHAGACFEHKLGICKGACLQEEPPDSYNQRVEQVIGLLSQYKKPNFVIVGQGRNTEERSIVCVENGQYLGFALVDKSILADYQPFQYKDFIERRADGRDIQKIIKQHLETSKDIVIGYNSINHF
ncbi:MAG: exonuclease domain-containing protein [Thermonemataceae bacterium]|nr:exonuclease domain-containing protein [Thermonemataceae bacterium]